MRMHRQRRAQGETVLSLDTPVAGGTEPLGCMLAETDGLAAWHGQNRCSVNDADLRHDLGRALGEPMLTTVVDTDAPLVPRFTVLVTPVLVAPVPIP